MYCTRTSESASGGRGVLELVESAGPYARRSGVLGVELYPYSSETTMDANGSYKY